jgi:hypothetical protein
MVENRDIQKDVILPKHFTAILIRYFFMLII